MVAIPLHDHTICLSEVLVWEGGVSSQYPHSLSPPRPEYSLKGTLESEVIGVPNQVTHLMGESDVPSREGQP